MTENSDINESKCKYELPFRKVHKKLKSTLEYGNNFFTSAYVLLVILFMSLMSGDLQVMKNYYTAYSQWRLIN